MTDYYYADGQPRICPRCNNPYYEIGHVKDCNGAFPPPLLDMDTMPAQALAAMTTQIYGVDVSHWQGYMNWSKARQAGARFAWAKASEGHNYIDDQWENNYTNARANGVLIAPYHFVRFNVSAEANVSNFLKALKGKTFDRPPTWDVELFNGVSRDRCAKILVQMTKLLLQAQPDYFGYTDAYYQWRDHMYNKYYSGYADHGNASYMWAYTSRAMWANVANIPEWKYLPLWVAHWGAGGNPAIPQPWASDNIPGHRHVHQYGTGVGSQWGAKSSEIDLNKWNMLIPFFTDVQPPAPPKPTAVIVAPSTAKVGEIVTFDGSQSTGEGLEYKWSAGDGFVIWPGEVSVDYAYMTSGTYMITLEVTDIHQQTAMTTQFIEITSEPLPPVEDLHINTRVNPGTMAGDVGFTWNGETYEGTFQLRKKG